MEETPLFNFSPHSKSHLKSQTYRTLIRMLSQPQLCQFLPLPPDNDANGRQHVLENQVCSSHESLPDKNGEERGFSDTQVVIDEIENIMRIEEDKDLLVDHTVCGTGLQDRDLIQAQHLLIDELKHVMKGNEDLVCHNNSGPVTNQEQNAGDIIAVSNKQDEHFELHSIVIEECGAVGQLQLDEETQCQNNNNNNNNNNMSSEVSKPVDNCEGSSLSRTDGLEVNNEVQQKEILLDKSVCADAAMGYPTHTIEDGEVEEGEVSGEFEVDDGSVNAFFEDAVVPQEKKVDEEQASEAIIDKNRFPFNEKNEANKKNSQFSSFMVDSVENAKDRREVEAQQCLSSEMACKRKVVTYEDPILAEEGVRCKKQKKCHGAREQNEGSAAKKQKKDSGFKERKEGNVANDGVGCPVVCPNNLTLFTEKSDQNVSANQGIASKEKLQDAGLCNKKKRGPPSKEKKAKKKQKERKKRAEKNRQLGVKRMKLHPVLNPKPVSHCRHYLKGRCREGEKCKFSHDAIPLTKFEPCHHFARHKCMKGDNCPYDHQLSKYPCTNYVSKGHCIRGESCMFSHKFPLQEDLSSTSNVCTSNVQPPSLSSTSNSKRQLDVSGTSNQTAKTLPDCTGIISDRRCAALNTAKTVQNLPALNVPKGISFLSGGKSSMVESSPKPSSPLLKSNEFVKVGNQIDQCASVTVQNCNEIPKKIPPVVAPPKGINFLSFGKAPLDKCSSTMTSTSLAINQGTGVNLFSSKKEACSSPNKDNSVLVGKEVHESMSNVAHRLNKMLLKADPAAFRDASSDGSRRSTEASSLPLSSGSGVHASVQESKIASNKHQESSVLQERLLASPLGSRQSSDRLAHECLKNTPISAQKSLMSTLAFAAKVGSLMKMNQSFAVNNVASKENRCSATTPRGSQIDSEKASKVLDFLSGIGGETKQ